MAIYAALALVGAPIWLLIRPSAPPLSDAFACPVLGLAALELFAWYWLSYGHGGMARGLPILLAGAALVLVPVAWAKRATLRAPSWAQCASTAALLAAVAVVFMCEFRVPLRTGHLTSGSIWNADIALYVTVSTGLVTHGFAWTGNIVGLNLGTVATAAKGIGPGVYSTLGAAAAGTGVGTWQAALPLLLVGVGLGALAIRDAARLLLPGSRYAAPVIAVLATSASLFAYVTTNYFLAQVLVMPLAIGELLLLHWIAQHATRRDRIGGLVLLVAIVAIATLSYSPMAFVMQPILLAAVCLGEVGRGWLRRTVAAAGSVAAAFALAFALAPEPFRRSFDFVRVSLREDKGWPLALMTPRDLLGFHEAVHTPRPVVGVFLGQAFVVGAVVLGALWVLRHERRRAALVHAAAALVVLVSYAAAYAAAGYSYEQWKWISFFQPMFIAAVFALVVAAAAVLLAQWMPAIRATGRLVGAAVAVVLIAASARILVAGTGHSRAVWVAGAPTLSWNIVDARLSKVADAPALANVKAVNVDLPQWDEMWAAYFLQSTMRVYPLSPSYLPVTEAGAALTLVAKPDPAARPPASRYVVVKRAP